MARIEVRPYTTSMSLPGAVPGSEDCKLFHDFFRTTLTTRSEGYTRLNINTSTIDDCNVVADLLCYNTGPRCYNKFMELVKSKFPTVNIFNQGRMR